MTAIDPDYTPADIRWRVRRREFDAWHARLTGLYVSPDRIEPPSNASRARIGARR